MWRNFWEWKECLSHRQLSAKLQKTERMNWSQNYQWAAAISKTCLIMRKLIPSTSTSGRKSGLSNLFWTLQQLITKTVSWTITEELKIHTKVIYCYLWDHWHSVWVEPQWSITAHEKRRFQARWTVWCFSNVALRTRMQIVVSKEWRIGQSEGDM